LRDATGEEASRRALFCARLCVKEGAADLKKAAKKQGKKGTGLIAYLTETLLAGKSTDDILAGLQKACPGSKAGRKDVSIVRSKLRKDGRLPA